MLSLRCNQDDLTALHVAAKYGHAKLMRILLQAPLSEPNDVNVDGRNELTPLHVATHFNNVTVVIMLLEKGANASAPARVSSNG